MNPVSFFQFARRHYDSTDDLYIFFDRCVCHLIGLDPDNPAHSAQPSSTARLYDLAARVYGKADAA